MEFALKTRYQYLCILVAPSLRSSPQAISTSWPTAFQDNNVWKCSKNPTHQLSIFASPLPSEAYTTLHHLVPRHRPTVSQDWWKPKLFLRVTVHPRPSGAPASLPPAELPPSYFHPSQSIYICPARPSRSLQRCSLQATSRRQSSSSVSLP